MLVSYKWVCEIAKFHPKPEDLANKLTFSGLEVDNLTHLGLNFENIVVGIIKSKEPHPKKDNLSCVVVDSGQDELPVVCGAPNCPGPKGRVILAKVGSKVGNLSIEPKTLAGTPSRGMLCSEDELGIGPDKDGIIVLGDDIDAPAGTPIVEALNLEDWIFDLGITPNRPDAVSHRGIAREMCLLYGKQYSPDTQSSADAMGPPTADQVHVELSDQTGCPRYMASVISGVTIGPSPFNLRYRLHNLNVRPISNMVDITNLIMLEWGQPLHAFDLDQVANKKIIIRKAVQDEKMITLDEVPRTLTSQDLLICDGQRPVALAGVMGGLDTGVTKQTKNVLIECAYFEPTGIRRTSKRLKLSSESSYRFERGVDPNMGPAALEHSIALVQNLAGGTASRKAIDSYPKKIKPAQVTLRPKRFEAVMGYATSPAQMKSILEGLGAIVEISGDKLNVEVPTSRPDIEREIDLIEEVARINGLDKVPSILPRIQCTIPNREEFEAIRKAKEMMASLGLEESISYSFVPKELLTNLSMANNVVKVANPLSAERAYMRTTLLAGLLENLKRADSRYVPLLKQFEVGRTFKDVPGKELPTETLMIAAIMNGPRYTWVTDSSPRLDYFDMKGVCSSFIWELFGLHAKFEPTKNIAYLHPEKSVAVLLDGKKIGIMGELHPQVLAKMKLPRGAVVMELAIMEAWTNRSRPTAQPLSEFPPTTRDVAFLVKEKQDTGPMAEALLAKCGDLAVDVSLFDIYRGKGIEKDSKSVAFSVTYRALDRTLTDAEVDAAHRKAVKTIAKQFEAAVR